MDDFNKRNLKRGGKVLLIFIFALIAIMSFAGVLNAVSVNSIEGFIACPATVNFIAEAVLIYFFGKNLLKEDK